MPHKNKSKQQYLKEYYQKHRLELLKKRRKKRKRLNPPRQRKHCNLCGKELRRVDHISKIPSHLVGVREATWKRKKYCSEKCAEKAAKELFKKYVSIWIHKDTKQKIIAMKYGKRTINSILKDLLEYYNKDFYGSERMGYQPEEVPSISKILCLEEINQFGKLRDLEKGDNFLVRWKEGDEIGKDWQNDSRFRVVNILSASK